MKEPFKGTTWAPTMGEGAGAEGSSVRTDTKIIHGHLRSVQSMGRGPIKGQLGVGQSPKLFPEGQGPPSPLTDWTLTHSRRQREKQEGEGLSSRLVSD